MNGIQDTAWGSYTEERLRRERASEGKGGNGQESIRPFYGDGFKRPGTSEIMFRNISHSELEKGTLPYPC